MSNEDDDYADAEHTSPADPVVPIRTADTQVKFQPDNGERKAIRDQQQTAVDNDVERQASAPGTLIRSAPASLASPVDHASESLDNPPTTTASVAASTRSRWLPHIVPFGGKARASGRTAPTRAARRKHAGETKVQQQARAGGTTTLQQVGRAPPGTPNRHGAGQVKRSS